MPSPIVVLGLLVTVGLLIVLILLAASRLELTRDKRIVIDEVRRRGGRVEGLRWSMQYGVPSAYSTISRSYPGNVFEVTYRDNDGHLRQAVCRPSRARHAGATSSGADGKFWSDDHPLDEPRPSGRERAEAMSPGRPVDGSVAGGNDALDGQITALRAENARLQCELERRGEHRS